MTENTTPNYYGILPANVRYCKGLCANAKVLYTELTALTQKEGYCFASNNYFAELYGVHKNTVSRWFSKLEQNGFIRVEIEENYRRKVWINENVKGGTQKDVRGDTQKGVHNTTSNNTKNNIYIPEIQELFKTWIYLGLSQHKEEVVKREIKQSHVDSFKQFPLNIWKKMISDYQIVYDSSKYYYSHWFTFWDFIARGYKQFLPEQKPLENFLIKGQKNTTFRDQANSRYFNSLTEAEKKEYIEKRSKNKLLE